jgi:HPt (histidine-containing phosphotransfer) domain-containing protein
MSVLDPETVDQLRTLARETNSDLLHRLQASFARDTPPRLVALRTALVAGDADAVAFGLHTLSGSAANLGAVEVVATCREIESASETAGAPGLDRLLDQLERNAAEAGAELARVAAAG